MVSFIASEHSSDTDKWMQNTSDKLSHKSPSCPSEYKIIQACTKPEERNLNENVIAIGYEQYTWKHTG